MDKQKPYDVQDGSSTYLKPKEEKNLVGSRSGEIWADRFFIGSVALLAGFWGCYFGTMFLFRFGIPITSWHGLLFFSPALGVVFWLRPFYEALAITVGISWSIAMAVTLASPFFDFSFDGMAARQGMVEALIQAGTPKSSPVAHVLSAVIAQATGSINAGKAVNLLAGVAAFGLVLKLLRSLSVPREWTWVVAAVAALNPVFIYQLSSFYIDGFTASLLACLIPAFGLVLRASGNPRRWALLAALLVLVATSKISGLAYGLIFEFGFFLLLIFRYGFTSARALWAAVLLALLAGFAGLAHTLEKGRTYSFEYLHTAVDLKVRGYGVGGGSAAPPEASELSKIQTFLYSHLAPTKTMAVRWDWKFPFWFKRPELALFEDLEADPRSGGFGPLYGGMLLLAAFAGAVAVCQRSGLPWAVWIPALTILISCLLSQAWWARWVPQGWLVPIALAVPVLTLRPVGLAGILARLSVSVGLLNSILILAFYTSGCFQYQRILNGQIRFLRELPAPIGVHVPTFPSNRTWLRDAGVDFTLLGAPPPAPSLILQGTDTRVALPTDWKNYLRNPSVLREWNKRKLLEDFHP